MYPSSLAWLTTSLHFADGPEAETGAKVLKRKESVPENTPSIRVTSSPVATRSRRVERTGRPAPTVLSW